MRVPEHRRLEAREVRRTCDPAQFSFSSTGELEDIEAMFGQPRAQAALHLAAGIGTDRFNLFALGSSGLGKQATVLEFLEREAAGRMRPTQTCRGPRSP